MTLIHIEFQRCTSCIHDDRDTEGYMLSIHLFGLQVELWITARNPFK